MGKMIPAAAAAAAAAGGPNGTDEYCS